MCDKFSIITQSKSLRVLQEELAACGGATEHVYDKNHGIMSFNEVPQEIFQLH